MPTAAYPLSRLFLHLLMVLALVLQGMTVLAMRGTHAAPDTVAAASVEATTTPPCHVASTPAIQQGAPPAPDQSCCEGGVSGLCQWACSMAMTPVPPALFALPSLVASQKPATPSAGLSSRTQRVPLRPPIA